MFSGLRKLVREIHSEPSNGTLSWGRCAATGALIVASVAILHSVFHAHSVAGVSWTDAGGFIAAPYAANKVGTAVQAFSSNPVDASVVVPATAIPSSLATPKS